MSYHTTDLNGITEINPSVARMRKILATLDGDHSSDYPEVWISHLETGWCLTAFPGGTVLLDNEIIEDVIPRERAGLSQDDILNLWQLLAQDRIDELLGLDWPDDTSSESS